MNHNFPDLLELTPDEEPDWWDQNGTPRFRKFHHDLCPNIYADIIILYRVGCQGCDRTFLVQDSWRDFFDRGPLDRQGKIAIHYGDPPRHDEDPAGNTMNSEPVEIVEFWRRVGKLNNWRRKKKYEGNIDEINKRMDAAVVANKN